MAQVSAVEYITNRVQIPFVGDGTWKTVQIHPYVDSSASMVILQLEVISGGTPQGIFVQGWGSGVFFDALVQATASVFVVIECSDFYKRIQIQATDNTARVYALGSFRGLGSKPHAVPVNVTPTGIDVATWTSRIVTLEGTDTPEEVEAVILVAYNLTSNAATWGARRYTATGTVTHAGDQWNRINWVPCAVEVSGSGPFYGAWYQVYSTGKTAAGLQQSYTNFHEIGYIKKGFGFVAVPDLAPEAPPAVTSFTNRGVSAQIPHENTEGYFAMMKAVAAPHDHAVWTLLSTDPVSPRWGNTGRHGGCSRALFQNAPGFVDSYWYHLNAAAVDLWFYGYTIRQREMDPANAIVKLLASGDGTAVVDGSGDIVLNADGDSAAAVDAASDIVLDADGDSAAAVDASADITLDADGETVAAVDASAEIVLDASGETVAVIDATAEVILAATAAGSAVVQGEAAIVLSAAGETVAAVDGSSTIVLSAEGETAAGLQASATIILDASGLSTGAASASAVIILSATGAATLPSFLDSPPVFITELFLTPDPVIRIPGVIRLRLPEDETLTLRVTGIVDLAVPTDLLVPAIDFWEPAPVAMALEESVELLVQPGILDPAVRLELSEPVPVEIVVPDPIEVEVTERVEVINDEQPFPE